VTKNPPAEELQRLLCLVDFLEPLSEGALRKLARSAHCNNLEAGDAFVVGPEEHAERMLLLLRGQVQVCEIDPSGRELTIATLGYGVSIGATGLASRQMREMRVRALEPSLICNLHRQDLEEAIREGPEVEFRLAQLLGRRLVWMEARWADLASKEVFARLASMLLRLLQSEGVVTPEGYKIRTRYTHQQLATMVGANREAATRALKRLREEGAVQTRNRYIYVTDMEALKRASG
jgi:CRP/FNR family transcriptional regulator, cyclic AMP receptor protein